MADTKEEVKEGVYADATEVRGHPSPSSIVEEPRGLPREWDSRCWALGCTFTGVPEQLRKCSKCKIARYCSEKCQARDWWMAHRDRCGECAKMAPMAKTVVHPRCVLPIEEVCFPADVRGYLTSSTGHGERLFQTSWHFTKLEDASRQRWFLENGLGLLRREEWMRLLGDPSYLEALSNIWRLFYCDDAGLLAMVACEAPFLNTETSEPALLVRDKLRFLCHEKQRSIVALGSTVGLGVVFQRQPSTQSRKAVVGNDSCRQAFENIALTPMSPYHATMPTDKFVQLGMAPLLPSARAGGPAYRVRDYGRFPR